MVMSFQKVFLKPLQWFAYWNIKLVNDNVCQCIDRVQLEAEENALCRSGMEMYNIYPWIYMYTPTYQSCVGFVSFPPYVTFTQGLILIVVSFHGAIFNIHCSCVNLLIDGAAPRGC